MSDDQDIATRRSTLWPMRVIQVFLMLVVTALLVAHVAKWDVMQVDAITLALISMLMVIPLANLVTKVRVGEFEAEIGRDEVAKAQAKAATELPPISEMEILSTEKRVRELLSEDPRLALAKVRIELEETLRRLYAATVDSQADPRRLSLSRLVDGLVRNEVLSRISASALRDVISLANRAVHGENVEPEAAEELAMLGVRLARELRELNLERMLRPVETAVVTQDAVEDFRSARYKVTTVVPLVEKPIKNTYVLNQDQLDALLEGYEEYAEFIVGIERADGNAAQPNAANR